MTDTLYPLELTAALTTLEAVLDVCCGVAGSPPRNVGVPFVFPEVGRTGQTVGGDVSQNSGARVTYDIISIVGLGNDEHRYSYDPNAVIAGDLYQPDPNNPSARLGGVITTISGNRIITVQVKVEVFGAGSDMRAGAFTIIERCRTRLCLPSVNEALNAVRLAVNDIRDARTADFRDKNGGLVRCAYFELVLNAADCVVDDPVTTIETAEPTQETNG